MTSIPEGQVPDDVRSQIKIEERKRVEKYSKEHLKKVIGMSPTEIDEVRLDVTHNGALAE